jgi:hypothetical protein
MKIVYVQYRCNFFSDYFLSLGESVDTKSMYTEG